MLGCEAHTDDDVVANRRPRADDAVHLPSEAGGDRAAARDDTRATLQEGLRVRPGYDGDVHRLRRPVAVVPPQDVARVKLDVRRAHAALVAVEEVEPVPLPGQ